MTSKGSSVVRNHQKIFDLQRVGKKPNAKISEKNYDAFICRSLITDSTGQSAFKSCELLENGLLSFEK